MKYALIGAAMAAAMWGGLHVGRYLSAWLGTGGSVLVWIVIAGGATVALRGKGGQRG